MKLKKTTQKNWLMILMFMTCFLSQAQITNTWTGNASRKWNQGTNWSLGTKPTLMHDVVIPVVSNGRYPEVNNLDGIASCKNITIKQGASVKLLNSYGTLRIAGVINNEGGTFDATNGTVLMNGVEQILPASAFLNNTIKNLTIANNSLVGSTTLEGNLDVTGILTVDFGKFYTNDSLTLKSTATSSAMVGAIDNDFSFIIGQVTTERYIPGKRAYRFFCSSTTGGTLRTNWQEDGNNAPGYGCHITGAGGATNGFDASGNNSTSMYTFNNATGEWVAVANTFGAMECKKPYLLFVRGDRTIDTYSNSSPATNTVVRTKGTLTTGNVVLTDFNPNAGGFSFIANPYHAPVDMRKVLAEATNIVPDFVWIWDPTLGDRGGYVTVNVLNDLSSISESEMSRYLQPNQACFVRTDAPVISSLLTFKEAHKYTTTNTTPAVFSVNNEVATTIKGSLYRGTEIAEGSKPADGFVINFNANNSNEVNFRDAGKMTNFDENVGVKNSGKILSFENREMPLENEVLTLNTTNYKATEYTFKFNVSGITGLTPKLHDTYTDTYTELTEGEDIVYSFTVDNNDAASIAANRFNIVFTTSALESDKFTSNDFQIYPNPVRDNKFSIQTPAGGNTSVALYNQLGQQIACNTAYDGNTVNVTPQTNLGAGIYVVQVNNDGKTASKKLIIK